MIKKRLIKLLAHARKYIAYQVIWQWVTLVAQIVLMYAAVQLLYGVFLELAGEQQLPQQSLKMYLLMIVIAGVCRFLANRRASKASFAASVDVKRILREKIYTKLLRLGASYKEKVPTSEIVQLAGEGVEQLETYFGKFLSQFFYSIIAPLTLFFVLFHVSWKASLVLLVCVPLIPGVIMMVQKIARRLLSKYWDIYAGLGSSFLENLQGMTTLKIYQTDAKKAVEMDEESEQFRIITMKVLKMQLNSIIVMDVVAYGGAALGMIITLRQFAAGAVSLPDALWIILLAVEFFLPMRLLGSFFHIAMNGMAASDKIFRLLDMEEPVQPEGVLSDTDRSVVIRDLDFSYDENRQILHDVSMECPAGSLTSLVGTSGCGKSTIAGLLCGRNKGYSGELVIGAKELSGICEESLMKQITLVSANSHLFRGTVEDNLRMGKPDASEKELEDVLEKVNLLAFIQENKGLKTPVAEGGSNLSGGQRQRLALARALLHDSPIYIFDEATSNIDQESEEQIMAVIHQLTKTRTILLISHRLANVVESDRIYMMQDGRIAESGTHDQLMEAQGIYAQLFRSQQALEQFGKAVTT